jgi:fatty acid-binding protein DegV
MLRIGLVGDAAAEVPASVLAHPALRLLPVKIEIGSNVLLDSKDDTFTREFNRKYLDIKSAEAARSQPMTKDEIKQFYLSELAEGFDHVLGLFVMSSRSQVFQNAFDAASPTIAESMPLRQKIGLKGPLFVEAHDSLCVSSGYGVILSDLVQMLERNVPISMVRERLKELTAHAHTYFAPSQIDFLATRTKARGDKSAGGLAIAAAKLLGVLPIVHAHNGATGPAVKVRGVAKAREHVLSLAIREVQRGLLSPMVMACFSGDPAEIAAMPLWAQLQAVCTQASVYLELRPMSPTASINIGPDALGIGFCARPHSPEL